MRHDWTAAPNPDPPEVVDLIAPHDDGAVVRVRVRRVGGELRVVAFELHDDTGRVTTRALRRAGLGAVVESIGRTFADYTVGQILGDPWKRTVRRPGRRGTPDVNYARWAERYVTAMERDPRKPVQVMLADCAARGEYATESEIRSYLTRARDRGLLTGAPPGRPGGTLTAKARRILNRDTVRPATKEVQR